MNKKSAVVAALMMAVLCVVSPLPARAAQPGGEGGFNAALPSCDRACLYGVLDQYLSALVARDPARISWAKMVKNTENNVALQVGDGLWGTATGLGSFKLRFADTTAGQVGYFGQVQETFTESLFGLRLKVEDGKVSEVETIVFRVPDGGIIPAPSSPMENPLMDEVLPAEDRSPRERMISLANGYFDTLQLNDGTLFTQFAPDCNRLEDGTQTTHNPNAKITPMLSAMGCEEQFKLGYYRFDDRLRARRFPLVDEERGLVLAGAFLDHTGRLGKYKLTDGRETESHFRRPHSFCVLELFKIQKGKIRHIEVVLISVPYNMPSPWVPDGR